MGSDRSVDAIRDQISNWGRWGDNDEIGTVNYITDERRVAATRLVRSGSTVSLALPLGSDGLQLPVDQRLNPYHVMLQTGTDLARGVQRGQVGGWGYADDMITMALQAATHWDGLSHAFYDYVMYNGRSCELVTAEGASRNAIDKIADRIVTRGLLLDFPLVLGVDYLAIDHRISAAEAQRVVRELGVEPRSGDIMLFRTGNMARALSSEDGWGSYSHTSEPGIGVDALPWLHETEVAGVASDTWAFEVLPSDSDVMLPVHAAAIVYMGLLIGENFSLDELAGRCSRLGRWEFLLVAPALPFSKAVGAPINPLAVF